MQKKFKPDPENEMNDYINMVIENVPKMDKKQLERELAIFANTLLGFRLPKTLTMSR